MTVEGSKLLEDFNLLATTSRGNEEDLCSEIWYLLREMGDDDVIDFRRIDAELLHVR